MIGMVLSIGSVLPTSLSNLLFLFWVARVQQNEVVALAGLTGDSVDGWRRCHASGDTSRQIVHFFLAIY